MNGLDQLESSSVRILIIYVYFDIMVDPPRMPCCIINYYII